MDENDELSFFLDGVRTPYEPVIKSIRDFLGNSDDLRSSKGGGIIFFTKKSKENELMMQVFPFKKNLTLYEDKELVSDESLKKILKKINEQKPYPEFWHYEHFISNFSNENHLKKIVPLASIFNYIDYSKADWDNFANDVFLDKIPKHIYEQATVKSGCTELSLIPLPVLSTPSIIIVVDNDCIKGKEESVLKSLYFRSRDIIAKYLYSRLLFSLREFIKKEGDKISEDELLMEFIAQLCHILLPISYKINDDPEIIYYDKWPKDTHESIYVLNLIGKYKIVFKLTTFTYLNFEKFNTDDPPFKLIHDSEMYRANVVLSANLIQSLFAVLYDTWELTRTIEDKVLQKLQSKLEEIGNYIGIELTQLLKVKFNEIKSDRSVILGEREKNNVLEIKYDPQIATHGTVFLKIDGHPILNNVVYPTSGKGNNKLCGFMYLYEIIRQHKDETNPTPIDVVDLFDNTLTPQKKKSEKINLELELTLDGAKEEFENEDLYLSDEDKCEVDEYESASGNIKYLLDSLTNTVNRFCEEYKSEINTINSTKTFSSNDKFLKGLVFLFKTIVELEVKATKLPQVSVAPIKSLAKILRKADEVRWDELYKSTTAKRNNEEIVNELRKVDRLGNNKSKKKQFVRDCIRACIREIKESQGDPSPVKTLIRNLEKSGLIKAGDVEPLTYLFYKYDQYKSGVDFIDWHLI